MGTLYEAASPPIINDLKVSIQTSTIVYPSQPTQHRFLFLSNIDKVLDFHVQTLHFFPPNPDFPAEAAVPRLRNALQRVMVEPYDFLAGRLKMNQDNGRLEVECNGAGAGFVVATTQFSLDEIGDLVYPNPAFMGLIIPALDKFHDNPLCVLQVTTFKCGGFAMGLSTNHALYDGMSFKVFLENLASQAFDDKPIAIIPCHDRHLLDARSPPQVTFPHPELLKLKRPIGQEEAPSPELFKKQQDLDFKIFNLTSNDISYLKEKAKTEGTKATTRITGFNVVTALVWRCKALCAEAENKDRESMVLYSVDIRSRLKPPLPMSYCGNAVLTAYSSAKCSDLEEWAFSKLVDMISEGTSRMTDEYARSSIDWGEIYKGFPHGEFLISSWWRLGFDEVEFPWGRARYSCPLVYRRDDIILLFPEIGGGSSNGVNVLVALSPNQMDRFQALFKSYLS